MSHTFEFDDEMELDPQEKQLLFGESSNPPDFSRLVMSMDEDDESDDYADGVDEERWNNASTMLVVDRSYDTRATLNEIVNLSPFVRMMRTICYRPKPAGGQAWFEVGAIRKVYAINLIVDKHFLRNANFWREICNTRNANTAMVLDSFVSDAMQWISQQKGDARKGSVTPVYEKHYELLFFRMDSVTGCRNYDKPDGRASDVPGGIRSWIYDITPYTDDDVSAESGAANPSGPRTEGVSIPPVEAPPSQGPLLSDDDDLSLDDDAGMQIVPPPAPTPAPAAARAPSGDQAKKKGYDPVKKMAAGVNKVLAEGQRVRSLMEKRTGNDDPAKRGFNSSRANRKRNVMHDKLDSSLERFACTSKDELRGKVAAYFNSSDMVETDATQHISDIIECAASGEESQESRLRNLLLHFREPRDGARVMNAESTFVGDSPFLSTPVVLLDKESAMAYNTECIAESQTNLANYIPTNRSEHSLADRFGDFYPSYPERIGQDASSDEDKDANVNDMFSEFSLNAKSPPRPPVRATNWRVLAKHMFDRFSSLQGLKIGDGQLGTYPFPNAVLIASKYVRFAEVQAQLPLPFSLGEIRTPTSSHKVYNETNLFESLHTLSVCSVQPIPFEVHSQGAMPNMIEYRQLYVSATKLIREDTVQSLNRAIHTAEAYSRQMFEKGLGKCTRPLTKYQFVQRSKSDLERILIDRQNAAEREVARRSDVNSIYGTTMELAHSEIKTTAAATTGNPDDLEDAHWREHQNAERMDANGERKRDTAMSYKMLTKPPESLENPFSLYADVRVSRSMDKDGDDCVLRDMDMAYHSYYLRLQKEFGAAEKKQYQELNARYELAYPDPTDRVPLESDQDFQTQKRRRLAAQVRHATYHFERNEDTELIHKKARSAFDTMQEPNVTIRHRMDLRPHSNWMAYLISILRWFFGAAVNYRLVILVIMSKEHGKRYFIDHKDPKNNLMIAGPKSKGKSWALCTAARLSVTTDTVTHRTALSEAAMGDNGGGAELQEEAEMALFGKEDKNGGDGNNIMKNIIGNGRIDTRRLRKDPDTGRMVREVISSNAQKVFIVCSNQPVEKMMSEPMKDRFIMVSLPDAEAGIGDRAIDRTMPSFLSGDHDSSDSVRVAKHIDFVYLLIEHLFRSGAFDHLDVMMDTANVLLGEIVHEIESHPGIRSIGPRKMNFIREFARTLAIRDAISVIFTSMYTHMYPTRENTGDVDCIYTQAQVEDFKARGVRVPFTVDVVLYLIMPFMVATSDHVATAVTMMDFMWSGNQHDSVMPVFVDVLLGGNGNGKIYKESIEKEERLMDIRIIKKQGSINRYIHHSQLTEFVYNGGRRERQPKLEPNYLAVEGGTRTQIHFLIKTLITEDPPSEENLASFFYSLSKKTFESRGVTFRDSDGQVMWDKEESRTKRAICRYSDSDGKPVLEVLVPYLLQHYNIQLANNDESGQTANEREFANERSSALREMIRHRQGLELDTLCELETSESQVLANARAYAKCHPLETIQTQAIVEVLSRNTTNLIGNDVSLTEAIEAIYREERGEIPWEKMIIQRTLDSYKIRGGPDDNIQNSVHGCSAKVPLHGIFKVLYVPRDPTKGKLYINNYNTATVSVASYFFNDSSGGFNGTGSERDRAARHYGSATNVYIDRDPDLNGVQLHQRALCLQPLPYPDDVRKAVAQSGNKMFDTPAYPVHRYFIEQYFDMYQEEAETLDLGGMNFEQYAVRPVITYPEHDIRRAVRDREQILAKSMSRKLKDVDLNIGLQASLKRANDNAISFDQARRGSEMEDAIDDGAKEDRWDVAAARVKQRAVAIARSPGQNVRNSGRSVIRSTKAAADLFANPGRTSSASSFVRIPRARKKKRMRGVSRTSPSSLSGGIKRSRQPALSPSERMKRAASSSKVDDVFAAIDGQRAKVVSSSSRAPHQTVKRKKRTIRLDIGDSD